MRQNLTIKLITLTLFSILSTSAIAQTIPLGAHFYFNKYLGNPAFAGEEEGLNLSLGIRKKMSGFPGAPNEQALVGQYRLERAGFGINFNNEKSGIVRRTRTVATYAYHLPLTGNNKLHFGVSLGASNDNISQSDVIGDPNDPEIINQSHRKTYFDGDFGVAYTTDQLTVQAALPNLKNVLNEDLKSMAGLDKFYSAISYKVDLDESIVMEPRVGFRVTNGTKNIVDIGTRVGLLDEKIDLFGMYHSLKSFSAGFSVKTLQDILSIHGIYTTATSAIRNNSNGDFEFGIKVNLNK